MAAGTATWPLYTNKTYPNFENPNWEPDDDPWSDDSYGNSTSDFYTDLPLAPNEYFIGSSFKAFADCSYGWCETLDYDEHPLEIQCSSCMLERIKYGISS